jgi:hypothetical protein
MIKQTPLQSNEIFPTAPARFRLFNKAKFGTFRSFRGRKLTFVHRVRLVYRITHSMVEAASAATTEAGVQARRLCPGCRACELSRLPTVLSC